MFTVKICNPGQTLYYETESINREVIEAGESIRFSANSQEHWFLLGDQREGSSLEPSGIEKAERIYIMNESGKTVDILRYEPKLMRNPHAGNGAYTGAAA